jgi:NADH:ubiquinone reductase (H+-translocating)
MNHTKIVIIGGGFAAVKCARTLRNRLSPDECKIVVYSRENHMVFHPLLADVAGASIHPDSAAATIRQMVPGVECSTKTVERIDISGGQIEFQNEQGQLEGTNYDHLVIACGAESNLGIIPGMSDHSFPFKTMRDAVALRSHIIDQLESAEACSDPERRKFHLSFVIIGGGFSGVELAGEVNDLIRDSVRFYSNFSENDISITLVHSQSQILPEVSATLRDFALKKMQRAGLKVLLKTSAAAATPEGVGLQDGSLMRAATVVCTIGTTPSPIIQHLEVKKERGRLVTDPDMRLNGLQNVWAVGDCAYITNAFDNKPAPTTGQFAEREGRQAAENIVRVLRGQPTRPFYFKPLGQLCSIGGHRAVAEMFGFRVSGILAWFMWRGVYLLKLPSWARRMRVGTDWAWDLIFPRDLGAFTANQSQHVSRAYYRPGDFIYRKGDPANSFYAIEQGEVEILRSTEEAGRYKPFAILGPGDFIGEVALHQSESYLTSIRARTVVRVVVMNRDAFSQHVGTMAPLRDIVAESVKRRAENLWLHFPAAKEALRREPLSSFLEPLPSETLKPDNTLEQAVTLLTKSSNGFLFVLDDQQRLWGVSNGADLTNAAQVIAYKQGESPQDVKNMQLREFVSAEPVTVSSDDSSLVAASTMLEHGLTWIPAVVSKNDRHLKGFVRMDKMSHWLLQQAVEQTNPIVARSQAAAGLASGT